VSTTVERKSISAATAAESEIKCQGSRKKRSEQRPAGATGFSARIIKAGDDHALGEKTLILS